jgi:hypothetical protein
MIQGDVEKSSWFVSKSEKHFVINDLGRCWKIETQCKLKFSLKTWLLAWGDTS